VVLTLWVCVCVFVQPKEVAVGEGVPSSHYILDIGPETIKELQVRHHYHLVSEALPPSPFTASHKRTRTSSLTPGSVFLFPVCVL
jgi:hypothetical protein